MRGLCWREESCLWPTLQPSVPLAQLQPQPSVPVAPTIYRGARVTAHSGTVATHGRHMEGQRHRRQGRRVKTAARTCGDTA